MPRKRGTNMPLEKLSPSPLWKRAFAYIIDILIIQFIIIMPFKPLLSASTNIKTFAAFKSQLLAQSTGELLIVGIVIAILSILYWAVFEYKFNQSIGKMAFNIFVSSQRKQLTFVQCFLRNISKISTLVLVADALYILLTRGHQRYLERLSMTEVLEKRWFL